MTSSTKESVMAQVMKLLNLAADEGASPHERTLAAERAERLMEKHMIDRMELKPEQKGKIISEEWFLNIGEMGSKANWEYFHNMQDLMETVATHCGCRMNWQYSYRVTEDTKKDYNVRVFKVVGFPEDLMFADRIWFRVFKEFVMNINPHWLEGKSQLGENILNYQKAGYKWPEIWRLAFRHQEEMRKTTPHWTYVSPTGRNAEIPDYRVEKTCTILGSVVRAYCKKEGIEYQRHTQRHEAYRSSFVRSFASTIASRLRAERRAAQEARGDEVTVDADKFALALRDTKEQVDAEFYRLFPEFDPDVQKRKREERDWNAWLEAEAIWNGLDDDGKMAAIQDLIEAEAKRQAEHERARKRARRNFGRVREARDNTDYHAWERGREAANRVNLRNDGEVKKTERRELD